MARCNNCGSELSNESTNCVVCGSTDIDYNAILEEEEMEEEVEYSQPRFTIGLIIWLAIIAIAAFVDIISVMSFMSVVPKVASIVIIADLLRVIGVGVLFMRKKIGFYLMVLSVLVSGTTLLIVAASLRGFLGLIGLAIIYVLLGRERNDEYMSLWDSMS